MPTELPPVIGPDGTFGEVRIQEYEPSFLSYFFGQEVCTYAAGRFHCRRIPRFEAERRFLNGRTDYQYVCKHHVGKFMSDHAELRIYINSENFA